MYALLKRINTFTPTVKTNLYCFLTFLLLAVSCTNKKNTVVTRAFHNLTSRYNGYYWATESINDGLFKIEQGHKEDYNKILPLFVYPDNVSSKTIYPEMDRAIKKSSLVIQRHAIQDKKTKQEIYGAVKWIDDNWIVIGQAHFYKREFFSGVEVFEFVAKSYKSKQRYEAKLWLIRTFNEIGTLSQSEPIIAALKNDKNFPKDLKKELSSLITDFYIKQGLWDEAAKELQKTIELTKKRKTKARYTFILGQILESKKDFKGAIHQYNKCIALKPGYEMLFNAKIKKARLYESRDQKIKGIKQELLKMAKDLKNAEYLDVIYFTLGEMEEKEKHIDQAMVYYKKSAQSSINNNYQKAASYLKLADNSFEKTVYVDASAYYDSAVAVLDKKHPDYDVILNKQKNLSNLITNLKIIQNEDSLQRIAKMDSSARLALIQKIIKKIDEEEERKKEELEKLKEQNEAGNFPGNNQNGPQINQNFGPGDWYMYNQQTKAFGINEFIKKFGNRKLEDNWRRSNKQSSSENLAIEGGEEDTLNGKDSLVAKVNDKKKPEYYLQGLPNTPEKIKNSDEKILEAYFQLGSIYREALSNRKKAVSTFDEMNSRFGGNKYEANSWYQCYRMCVQEKNNAKAETYKNLLTTKYPESDYTKILQDPDFQNAINAKKGEVELFYGDAYNLFSENKTREAFDKCNEGLKKFGKSDYSSRFALVRALCVGKLYGTDSLESALTSVIAKFSSDVALKNKAQEYLDALKNTKNPNTNSSAPASSLFSFNENAEHVWVCLLPKNFLGENSFKAKLSDFNGKFYSNAALEVNSIQYQEQGLIFSRKFKNKSEAMNYFEALEENNEPFDGAALAKNKCMIFICSQDNFQKMVQQKKLDEYLQFFNQNYLSPP
jgi:tetratricopeptide (TPR) repeat protein